VSLGLARSTVDDYQLLAIDPKLSLKYSFESLVYPMLQLDPASRRFKSSETLYGELALRQFLSAHVVVVGVGGVGSWAAEALARSGVGKLTLIDPDIVAESNINRQLIALDSTLFLPKVDVLGERLKQINPSIELVLLEEALSAQNCAHYLGGDLDQPDYPRPDLVIDCVDDTPAKLAMALYCRFNKLRLIMAGGAGGKTDPAKILSGDLRSSTEDPLLAKVRAKLREAGVNRDLKEPFKIPCVYSVESLKRAKNPGAKLACGGFGSSVVVTATFGMHLAALALARLEADSSKA
jgi:tRNA A37 threonylcarbamoyladenosine dehydratase